MNKIAPKVSIIIPVYNVEQYVSECLESVVNQTLREIEIICIHDKSTDGSLEILNKYAAKDKRIHIINNKENKGPSFARNRGMEVAKGEYIYFLDSDDMIVPEAMKELYYIAQKEDLELILFDTKQIFENENFKNMCEYKSERDHIYPGVFTGAELLKTFMANEEYDSSPCRQFWNRRYLLTNKLFFYEGILHEDLLFSVCALLKTSRSKCLKRIYHIYKRRENSITTKKLSWKNIEGVFTCYCQMLFLWKNENYDKEINVTIEKYINSLYMEVKKMYKKVKNTERVENFSNTSPIIKYMFNQFIELMENQEICKTIEKNKLKVIKSFKNIIIYGAGVVARDVLNLLDKNQIGIYGLAISERSCNSPQYIMGHKVFQIDELKSLKQDSLVLVAVTKKHQNSIIKNLEELNFEHIMCVL